MITEKDYKPPMIPSNKMAVEFGGYTVISEKEFEKLYVDVGGKEIKFLEWIKQVAMR